MIAVTKFYLPYDLCQQPKLGFIQAGHDIVTSAGYKSRLLFGLDELISALVLNSTLYFQSAAVIGRRNTNPQPA